MKTKTKKSAVKSGHIIALVTASLVLTANADPITPVGAKQSSAFSVDRVAANLGNATGMDGAETLLYNHDGSISGEPTSANGSQWVTRSESLTQTVFDDGKVWATVDLGAVYDLTTVKIWNFQWNLNGTTDLSNRGISLFDVYVRNSEADTDDGTGGGTEINAGTVGALYDAKRPGFRRGNFQPVAVGALRPGARAGTQHRRIRRREL